MNIHMQPQTVVVDPRRQQTFTVMFSTLGMSFCAGQYKASSIDTGKHNATNLLQNRRVAKLESAEIRDSEGKVVAVLRTNLYPKEIEWVTIRR